jgi:aldose 1-epimerase
VIELRAGALRLVLAPEVGGAVVAFERDGVALFRATDAGAVAAANVRRFASYPLVPFSNRIAAATLHWGGANYTLARFVVGEPHAIHGNGWRRSWRVVEAEPSRASLELDHDAVGPRAREWPFAYSARQDVALEPDVLTMRLALTNTSSEAFPCGLGWHPFFPRDASTELRFAAASVWEIEPTKLPTQRVPLMPSFDFSVARPIGDAVLDHCFAAWQPPALICWPERCIAVEIDADAACRHLVVYVPAGRDYFSVEPVSHMTDAFNRAARGTVETGTRALPPGETFSCTMRISVRFPA